MLIMEVPDRNDEKTTLEELGEEIALIQLETKEEAFITNHCCPVNPEYR
jgi:hypothetical protein